MWQVSQLLAAMRPNAVALVDAFDIPDLQLKSALGRYDGLLGPAWLTASHVPGNVYEAMHEAAQREPLNKSHVRK